MYIGYPVLAQFMFLVHTVSYIIIQTYPDITYKILEEGKKYFRSNCCTVL
jgi:hypothetical protein